MAEVNVEPTAGVWERRKLAAMARIQRVALDLFEEDGYRGVTVDRIALEAGVSPSSVYRYFGTKEMLVLYDEHDLRLLEEMRGAAGGARVTPAELVAAARALAPLLIEALLTEESELRIRRRMRYVSTIPEVADAQNGQMREMEAHFVALFAERTGRDGNDLRLRMAAATAVWCAVAALDQWAAADFDRPVREVYTEAITLVIDAVERLIA
ncbi:TetR/AcrR family transcriptional regulator [Nocardia takedensis]|uniref:TetR/AcrR family transcriptional regulator n=1 Tax=Nocardia takedensis TaxID=259390 RepID=UPI0012F67B24|nr:TetR/AcrR family transcriptional regulator [Nocardia takedensis]